MMATEHPVAAEEIMALIDGELATGRAKSVSAHIETCPDCQKVATSLSSTSQYLASWVVEARTNSKLEELIAANARAACHESSNRRGGFGLRRPYVWAAGLGTLAMIMIVVNMDRRYELRLAQSQALSEKGIRESRGRSIDVDLARTSNGTLGKLETKQAHPSEQANDYRNWLAGGPMIARTVSLWIVAKDFGASHAALDGILVRHHGYAANLSVNAQPNAARSLQASLRVPASELSAVLTELKALGRVQNEAQNGEEVTQQHADLLARLKNSREEETRLRGILRNRTGKIGDVLAVEQEIARVRGEIEQMEAEQKSLEHRVDFATVEVNLSEEYKAQLGTPAPSISTRFHNALVMGVHGAQDTIVGIVLFCAEVGPSLVLWAVLLVPAGWFLWRRWRRSFGLVSSASL